MPRTTPTPPPAAVAKDAHWTATRERLLNRNRATATLTICDDHQVKERLERARRDRFRAKARLDAEPDSKPLAAALAVADEALAAAEEAFEDAAIVLTFRALPRKEFVALREAHPPTEEEAEAGVVVDVESIAPDLIAAASADGLTPDDVRVLLEQWSEGEAAQLFAAAWDVQSDVRMDLGKG